MSREGKLYPTFVSLFLVTPKRPLPDEMVVIGAGATGSDIACYLRNSL